MLVHVFLVARMGAVGIFGTLSAMVLRVLGLIVMILIVVAARGLALAVLAALRALNDRTLLCICIGAAAVGAAINWAATFITATNEAAVVRAAARQVVGERAVRAAISRGIPRCIGIWDGWLIVI